MVCSWASVFVVCLAKFNWFAISLARNFRCLQVRWKNSALQGAGCLRLFGFWLPVIDLVNSFFNSAGYPSNYCPVNTVPHTNPSYFLSYLSPKIANELTAYCVGAVLCCLLFFTELLDHLLLG